MTSYPPASASLSIADVLEYAPDQRWFEQELAFWGGSSPDEMEALFQEFDDAAGRVLAAATLPLEDGEIRDWAEALARSIALLMRHAPEMPEGFSFGSFQ